MLNRAQLKQIDVGGVGSSGVISHGIKGALVLVDNDSGVVTVLQKWLVGHFGVDRLKCSFFFFVLDSWRLGSC